MRVAWFSPLPPDRSGIATYCAELLPLLARNHSIDAFIDDSDSLEAVARVHAVPGVCMRGAHEFPWRHARAPYGVIVYQIGNELCHDYMWPYMVRYPGLVVLHDGQLHHARAAGMLRKGRLRDYRAEFAYSHPRAPRALHELVISGLGESAQSVYFDHPMVKVPVEAARVAAVHNAFLADELAEMVPGAAVSRIRQGVRDLTAGAEGRSAALRATMGLPADAVIFAAIGRATPEKRLSSILRALAKIKASHLSRETWLMCVGATADYYDVRGDAEALGVADRLVVTGYVDDGDIGAYLALADVCLCLRWPTGRETSASWLRCLAAAKPTVISSLAHLTDVPAIDPRTLETVPLGDVAAEDREPIAMIVELTDEVQMLRLAMRHLTESVELRARLGKAARRYWQRHATVEMMAADYEALLERTRRSAPNPHPPWPAHLVADGTEQARSIANHVGVEIGWM